MDTDLALAYAILIFGLIVFPAIYFLLRWLAPKAQRRCFDGLEVYEESGPGRVEVVFHTYYGFLLYAVQTEHRFWAEPEHAAKALWRLHRFTLIWGHFAYGMLVIPLLSMGNYSAQLRSIRKQMQLGGTP